ncbi:hypothetical protein [Ornithinimicrobium cryptoxanthini]|uniref:Lipoprotein n=1 Tax=Ornithinimicrobium cryptoxanthini TaxID=2934161 RepID=A0ABY4YGL3_9MICO|nr:hypothetical protein [Ornithinimicrobium cryptoxanthini]USQ75809.1 hypothetical protein NF557_14545 [Ornithinimicrobium cryptoxanthini]
MKLSTSTAVIALLVGSVALGACGQEDAESDTADAARANSLGYGNYAPRGPAVVAAQPPYSRGNSVDAGQNFSCSDQTQAPRRSSRDPDKVSRFE